MQQPSHVNNDPRLPSPSQEHSRNSSALSSTSPRETPNFSRPLQASSQLGRSTASPTNTVESVQPGRSTSTSPRPLPSVPGRPQSRLRQSLEHVQSGRGSGLGTRIIDDRDPDDIAPPQKRGRGQDEDDQTSTAASDSELLYASAPSSPVRPPAELPTEDGRGDDGTIRVGRIGDGRQSPPERRVTVALGENATGFHQVAANPRRAATIDYNFGGNQGGHMPEPHAPQPHEEAARSRDDGQPGEGLGDEAKAEANLREFIEQSENETTYPEPQVHEQIGSPSSFPEPQLHQSRPLPQPMLFGLPLPESHMSAGSEKDNQSRRSTESMPYAVTFPVPATQRQNTTWRSPSPSAHGAQGPAQVAPAPGKPPLFIAGTDIQFEPLAYPHELDAQAQTKSYTEGPNAPAHPPRPLPPSPVVSQGSIRSTPQAPATVHDSTKAPEQENGSSHGHVTIFGSDAGPPAGAATTAPLRISKHAPSAGTSSGIFVPPPGNEQRSLLSPPPIPATEEKKHHSDSSASLEMTSTIAKSEPTTPESTLRSREGIPVPPSPASTHLSPTKPLKPVLKRRTLSKSRPPSRARESVDNDTNRPPPTPPKPVSTHETETTGTLPRVLADETNQESATGPRPQSLQQNHISDIPPAGRHTPPAIQSQHPRTVGEEKAKYNAIAPSSRSRYMNMLLALDDIPTVFNLSASFFTWILLAGFVLLPGTFTSIENLNLGNGLGAVLVNRIVNLPLFVVAFICTGIGILGMGYLWWRWMNNYIWLVGKIFLPGFLNALAGVISTLVNVYGVQNGDFNTTSIITISVTGGVAVVCGLLVLWYGVWLLGRVKKSHEKEIGVEKAGSHGEGMWGGFKEKVGRIGKKK